jgi:thiazole/oxazole-forming peptide maturase SagD family component
MNTTSNHTELFDKEGYIELRKYLTDIFSMMKSGPWKLPLRIGDRINLRFLSVIDRLSWLSSVLHVLNPHPWSPSYSILYSFLHGRGFVDRVSEVNVPHEGYYSFVFEKDVILHNDRYIISGQGVDTDKERAFSKGLGEIIERMVSGLGDTNKNVVIRSYAEMKKKFPTVYPPTYHRFLEIQKKSYRELNTTPEKPLEWVLGENIVTGHKTYIPKKMTSWFKRKEDFKDVLQNSTSNGCAGYFTRDGAVLRGLLEVVHRDSFLVHWLTSTPPQVVAQETLPESVREIIESFREIGISIEVLNTTSIAIPSIMIVGISRHAEESRIAVSGASAVTFEEAIVNGLTEMMALIGVFTAEAGHFNNKRIPTPFISTLDLAARRTYWQRKENVKEFQWFLSGKVVSFEEISKTNLISGIDDASKLEACLDILKKTGEGYCPIVYYPINKIQKELGFYVAQVYIPKAFPLYLLEYQGTFDSDRLREFAGTMGKKDFKLNHVPHLFL